MHDLVRGPNRFEHVHMDDPVIARADGSVLYNFAVAIDDLDSRITHVVRGEDHVSNTPKQLLVIEAARAAGLTDAPDPVYAHLPLLHGPDGKKLSKRHGAASVQELREAGYLPEAVRNYLALLGWGAGDDEHGALDRTSWSTRFTLERVSRNPARFDETKLRWLNGVYMRELDPAELARRLERVHRPRRVSARRRGSARRRSRRWRTSGRSRGALLDGPVDDPAARERWLGDDGRAALADARAALAAAAAFDEASIEAALSAWSSAGGAKPRQVYQPLRVAITGTTISPGIFESLALLGPRGDARAHRRRPAARLSRLQRHRASRGDPGNPHPQANLAQT